MNLLAIALLFFVLAAVLAFVDLFLPTGGILSILGGISAVACVTFAFQHSILAGTIAVVMVVAAAPLLFAMAVKIWPMTPIGKRVLLKQPEKKSGQLVATEIADARELIGRELVLDASIFPSGIAELDGKSIRVTAEGGYLEAETQVRLVDYRDREYVVRPVRSKPSTPTVTDDVAPAIGALSSNARDRGASEPSRESDNEAESPPKDTSQREQSESGNLLDLPTEQFGLQYELDEDLSTNDAGSDDTPSDRPKQ